MRRFVLQLITNDKFSSVEHRVRATEMVRGFQLRASLARTCFQIPRFTNRSKSFCLMKTLLSTEIRPYQSTLQDTLRVASMENHICLNLEYEIKTCPSWRNDNKIFVSLCVLLLLKQCNKDNSMF